jgi:hypothetical protein
MEAMLGISLYSYPYLKLAKNALPFLLLLCLLFNKIVLPGSEGVWEHKEGMWGRWERCPNNVCTYE